MIYEWYLFIQAFLWCTHVNKQDNVIFSYHTFRIQFVCDVCLTKPSFVEAHGACVRRMTWAIYIHNVVFSLKGGILENQKKRLLVKGWCLLVRDSRGEKHMRNTLGNDYQWVSLDRKWGKLEITLEEQLGTISWTLFVNLLFIDRE